MNLVTLNPDTIRLHQPLPFTLRSADGALLARRGYVINSRVELERLVLRGVTLCIDVDESEEHHRAYVGKLNELIRNDQNLEDIAKIEIAAVGAQTTRDVIGDGPPDWLDLQSRTNTLLRDPQVATFGSRLQRLHTEISRHAQRAPDAALLALIHLTCTEFRMYSALHAMLVCAICELAARDVLQWPADDIVVLGRAALTMNISMTVLQDKLAQQVRPSGTEQISEIEQHARESVHLLRELGVSDQTWLRAVLHHADNLPGNLSDRTPALRMARLIRRADLFAALLAPRAGRAPMSPAAAMKSCYFDEQQQIDDAGAALIKTVGIYPPGSFVRLVTQELAVVVRRSVNTTTPRVAVLVNRHGLPTGEPIFRDTSQSAYRIASGVAHSEVKIQLSLERLLALV